MDSTSSKSLSDVELLKKELSIPQRKLEQHLSQASKDIDILLTNLMNIKSNMEANGQSFTEECGLWTQTHDSLRSALQLALGGTLHYTQQQRQILERPTPQAQNFTRDTHESSRNLQSKTPQVKEKALKKLRSHLKKKMKNLQLNPAVDQNHAKTMQDLKADIARVNNAIELLNRPENEEFDGCAVKIPSSDDRKPTHTEDPCLVQAHQSAFSLRTDGMSKKDAASQVGDSLQLLESFPQPSVPCSASAIKSSRHQGLTQQHIKLEKQQNEVNDSDETTQHCEKCYRNLFTPSKKRRSSYSDHSNSNQGFLNENINSLACNLNTTSNVPPPSNSNLSHYSTNLDCQNPTNQDLLGKPGQDEMLNSPKEKLVTELLKSKKLCAEFDSIFQIKTDLVDHYDVGINKNLNLSSTRMLNYLASCKEEGNFQKDKHFNPDSKIDCIKEQQLNHNPELIEIEQSTADIESNNPEEPEGEYKMLHGSRSDPKNDIKSLVTGEKHLPPELEQDANMRTFHVIEKSTHRSEVSDKEVDILPANGEKFNAPSQILTSSPASRKSESDPIESSKNILMDNGDREPKEDTGNSQIIKDKSNELEREESRQLLLSIKKRLSSHQKSKNYQPSPSSIQQNKSFQVLKRNLDGNFLSLQRNGVCNRPDHTTHYQLHTKADESKEEMSTDISCACIGHNGNADFEANICDPGEVKVTPAIEKEDQHGGNRNDVKHGKNIQGDAQVGRHDAKNQMDLDESALLMGDDVNDLLREGNAKQNHAIPSDTSDAAEEVAEEIDFELGIDEEENEDPEEAAGSPGINKELGKCQQISIQDFDFSVMSDDEDLEEIDLGEGYLWSSFQASKSNVSHGLEFEESLIAKRSVQKKSSDGLSFSQMPTPQLSRAYTRTAKKKSGAQRSTGMKPELSVDCSYEDATSLQFDLPTPRAIHSALSALKGPPSTPDCPKIKKSFGPNKMNARENHFLLNSDENCCRESEILAVQASDGFGRLMNKIFSAQKPRNKDLKGHSGIGVVSRSLNFEEVRSHSNADLENLKQQEVHAGCPEDDLDDPNPRIGENAETTEYLVSSCRFLPVGRTENPQNFAPSSDVPTERDIAKGFTEQVLEQSPDKKDIQNVDGQSLHHTSPLLKATCFKKTKSSCQNSAEDPEFLPFDSPILHRQSVSFSVMKEDSFVQNVMDCGPALEERDSADMVCFASPELAAKPGESSVAKTDQRFSGDGLDQRLHMICGGQRQCETPTAAGIFQQERPTYEKVCTQSSPKMTNPLPDNVCKVDGDEEEKLVSKQRQSALPDSNIIAPKAFLNAEQNLPLFLDSNLEPNPKIDSLHQPLKRIIGQCSAEAQKEKASPKRASNTHVNGFPHESRNILRTPVLARRQGWSQVRKRTPPFTKIDLNSFIKANKDILTGTRANANGNNEDSLLKKELMPGNHNGLKKSISLAIKSDKKM